MRFSFQFAALPHPLSRTRSFVRWPWAAGLRPTGVWCWRVNGEHAPRSLERYFGDLVHTAPLRRDDEQCAPTTAAEHTSKAPSVNVHSLQDRAAFADAHAALVRYIRVPDSVVGVDADDIWNAPPRSAQTRRFDRLPSRPMSNAVSFFPWDSAMISVALSGVTAIPFGKAMPSATCRTRPSAVTSPMMPGSPLMYVFPRPSTTISFQKPAERRRKSAWGARDPSGSRRSKRPSRPETIRRRPSGNQSMQNGRPNVGRTMTSLSPVRLAAIIS